MTLNGHFALRARTRPPFSISFNTHNSVATEDILTKFGTETENGVPETVFARQILVPTNLKMAAAAILNFH